MNTDHEIPNYDSLTLAEDYVREALLRETHEQSLEDGDDIEVDHMGRCDCIPLAVTFDVAFKQGTWHLVGVRTKRFSSLSAIYEFEAKR